MTRRKRIALVGLGMAVTPHAKSLVDLADKVEVVRAISPSPQRRQAFAERFAFALGDHLQPVLQDDNVEIAAVLTPPNTHLEIVSALARAGKHILLEKPLEVASQRAEALVRVCADAGVTLGVVLQHRFKPAAERLAAILKAGGLGQIVSASASIRLWRPQSYYDEPGRGSLARDGGGVLLTQGIHTLDLLLSLAGPALEVCGYAATTAVHRMETEDLVCAAVRFASGAVGVIEATTAAYPGAPERIELVGTLGTATLAGTALGVAYQDGRLEEMAADASAGGTGADPMAFPHDYHLGVWRDFLAAVDERRPPRVSGPEALRVQLLIDALLAAAASHGKVKVCLGR
jgi:UDP-N-acetyl-2-amino-2-deoxyglucuronate dehydrogenase